MQCFRTFPHLHLHLRLQPQIRVRSACLCPSLARPPNNTLMPGASSRLISRRPSPKRSTPRRVSSSAPQRASSAEATSVHLRIETMSFGDAWPRRALESSSGETGERTGREDGRDGRSARICTSGRGGRIDLNSLPRKRMEKWKTCKVVLGDLGSPLRSARQEKVNF